MTFWPTAGAAAHSVAVSAASSFCNGRGKAKFVMSGNLPVHNLTAISAVQQPNAAIDAADWREFFRPNSRQFVNRLFCFLDRLRKCYCCIDHSCRPVCTGKAGNNDKLQTAQRRWVQPPLRVCENVGQELREAIAIELLKSIGCTDFEDFVERKPVESGRKGRRSHDWLRDELHIQFVGILDPYNAQPAGARPVTVRCGNTDLQRGLCVAGEPQPRETFGLRMRTGG